MESNPQWGTPVNECPPLCGRSDELRLPVVKEELQELARPLQYSGAPLLVPRPPKTPLLPVTSTGGTTNQK